MSEHGIDPVASQTEPSEGATPTATYSLFATFRVSSSHPVVLDGRDVPGFVRELEDVSLELADEGVSVRGWYDVSGVRSDADLLVWLQGGAPEDLQWSLRQLRRSALVQPLIRSWSALGVAVDSVPTGTASDASASTASTLAPKQWLSVCGVAERPSFVDEVSGAPSVTTQVIAACGVGEADWLVAREADELSWIVDHLRDAGGNRDRLGVIAGRLVDPAEIVEVLQ
ncbi:chlorite dismutase family protein [Leucobacter sp. NPDC058333]|uniref:chlorite dismutase family protein n=1 Tax=Leucobacter sp. NPDC058333 TaxID=3346450 RepID=UPI00364746B1